ncbi:RNA 3'-terminal phosphate cyclase/enolpyruvate transferase [Neurospora crassa]|nr:RNA 3'-terminal phosphate cyclase/enolpyruvate transferase [Neurospora crassa]
MDGQALHLIPLNNCKYEGGFDRLRLSIVLSGLFSEPVYMAERTLHPIGEGTNAEHITAINILTHLAVGAASAHYSQGQRGIVVLFVPHLLRDKMPSKMISSTLDGSAALLFLTVLPYILFCHLGSREIGFYDYYPRDYMFTLKITGGSYVLSSNGPSIIYLQKVFLPNLSLLGIHPRSFVDLSITKVENRFDPGSRPNLYITIDELELEMSINPLVAPLKRRIDLTNRGEIWRVTAYAHCPDYVSSRFKQLLENEMCAAFHCQRGPRDTGTSSQQENSDPEKSVEVEYVQFVNPVFQLREAHLCHVLFVAEALEPGCSRIDLRHSLEPTESYIGYELTCALPIEIIHQTDNPKVRDVNIFVSADEQADAFILNLIRDGLRGLRAELLHGHAVDSQQTWGFMSLYQLMAPSYVDWNDGSR